MRIPTSDTQQRSKNKSQNHNMMSDTINICFVFDEKFVDLFKVSILSIAQNTNSTLSVYIIDCGISKDGKSSIVELTNRLKNIESVTFGIPARISEIENFKIPAYFSSSVFYRLAIPKTFPELQRAIYLDCDIIAIGDIRELWNEDLHSRPIGIVEEKGTFFSPDWEEKHKNIINAPSDHTCIYSGVLLIDCTKFEKSKIFERVIDVINVTKVHLPCPEQDAMIICMDNDEHWPLSPKYNFLPFSYRAGDILKSIGNPVIVHYAGLGKPTHLNKKIIKFLDKLHILRKSIYFIKKFWEYSDQIDKDKFSGKKIKITVKFIYKKLMQPIERFFNRIWKKIKRQKKSS